MKLEGIEQRYGERMALQLDGFEFEPGVLYAVIGSNGSGKSTLAHIISGLLKPTRGTCRPAPGERVGYMPQASYAFYCSCKKNVQLGLPRAIPAESEEGVRRVQRAMEQLGIAHLADTRAKRLSGGETARMSLARVLVGDHDLLVLDEPTASLDVGSTLSAESMVRSYRSARGAAVILITHSMSQALRLADQVLFLDSGRLRESGPARNVLENPQTIELRRFLEVLGT